MLSLIKKELRQNWRSFRLPALYLTLLFFSLADPLTTKYMGQILQRFATGITITMPPPSAAQAMGQFLGDILEIGVFVIIAITMGAVASEKGIGVATFILTKPVSRKAYVGAKLFVLSGGVASGIALFTTLAYVYTWTLLGRAEPAGVILAALSTLVYAEFILAVTFASSMTLQSSLAAGGVGLLAFFLTMLVGSLLSRSSVGPYLPSTLAANISSFLATPANERAVFMFLRPGIVTLILSIAILVGGYGKFKREHLP
ncbi:MAG: hypothetical protein AB1774_07145 [Bacillota bacterium]